MVQLKRLLEGILFMTAEELKAEQLAEMVKKGKEEVEVALENLIKEYESRDSPIAVRKVGPYYSMTIKKEYIPILKKYVKAKELSRGDAKILAIIAAKQGIMKSILSKKLGSHVYGSIQELVKRGFIREVREGRSSRLFTTEKYKEYLKIYGPKEKQQKLS